MENISWEKLGFLNDVIKKIENFVKTINNDKIQEIEKKVFTPMDIEGGLSREFIQKNFK